MTIVSLLKNRKDLLNLDAALSLLFVILVASLFFNIKHLLVAYYGYILGESKDFTIIFLYISDILLFPFILCGVYKLLVCKTIVPPRGRVGFILGYSTALIYLLASLSYFGNFVYFTIPILSLYYLLFIAKAIVLHETIVRLSNKFLNNFICTFLVFLFFSSILGIYQFIMQKSAGLLVLGESIIGPYVWGAAKIEALGLIFSRSYALFPHPNIFGAFLALGIILGLGFTLAKAANSKSIHYLIGVLLLNVYILALFLTFSRAAWLATVVGVMLFFVFTWNKRSQIGLKRYYLTFVSLALSTFVIVLALLPLIQQRGNVFDKAYQERKSYNQAALEMIVNSPVVGVGPSESLIHMEQFLGENVEPWEVQPIHNYYLLLAAETGVPALILFLAYVCSVIFTWLRRRSLAGLQSIVLFIGLSVCLILMLFDHYFFTFQSSILLFWIWFGFLRKEVAHET